MTQITFSEAKSRLSAAMRDEGDAIQIDRETAAILVASYPANPEPDLSKAASFRAEYMRFLRPVVEATEHWESQYVGINVAPCAAGGALLIACNGPVCLVAHDKDAVTKDGLRFTAPAAVFDACVPPEPPTLMWEGEMVPVGDVPDYAIPGVVHAFGIGLLVMPKEQPEGTHPEDGGALFSWPVSTGQVHRPDDYRVYGVGITAEKLGRIIQPLEDAQQIGVTPGPIGVVAAAMAFAPAGYWHMRQHADATVWLHSEREDLMIILASVNADAVAPEIPAWAALEATK
jgi:hypothetical protein